jgi:hypothetical protein
MKKFLVQQWWACPRGLRVPVQATVAAKSRRKAEKAAEDACREAAHAIGAHRIGARPKGEPEVLHVV